MFGSEQNDLFNNKLYLVNYKKKIFTSPIEKIDLDEKKLIISDLMKSKPISYNMQFNNSNLLNFDQKTQKKPQEGKIGGYLCQKYEFKVEMNLQIDSKVTQKVPVDLDKYLQIEASVNT
jgi:hypothetical protein